MLLLILDAQITICQNMLSMVTTTVVGAIKEILIPNDSPLPPVCSGDIGETTLPPLSLTKVIED